MKQLHKTIAINHNNKFKVIGIKRIIQWLFFVAKTENKAIINIEYTLITDEELLQININSLNHNYYTDIITFDLGSSKLEIEGDIYISYDRVKENAKMFHVKQMEEMRRVFVHGLLHLLGYKDKTKKDAQEMRQKENEYLEIYNQRFSKK